MYEMLTLEPLLDDRKTAEYLTGLSTAAAKAEKQERK